MTPAFVISTSYSYDEADLTPFYTNRQVCLLKVQTLTGFYDIYTFVQCTEYAKLGLMGVTMLYSSGDFGVAGMVISIYHHNCSIPSVGHDGVCLNPDGKIFLSSSYENTQSCTLKDRKQSTVPCSTLRSLELVHVWSFFLPVMYYWSIWYQDITSVGATQINPGSTVEEPESACEQVIFSGGGFSNYFSIPSYQQSVVTSFLENFSSDNFTTAKFNASGTVSNDWLQNWALLIGLCLPCNSEPCLPWYCC